MTDKECLVGGYGVLYLIKCALLNEKANLKKLSNLPDVYRVARDHNVNAMCAYALDGVLEENDKVFMAFNEARDKAAARIAMFDMERAELEKFLNENKIAYMLLKGILMKELYPKPDMRQMTDNDIWYDKAYKKEVSLWFANKGYETIKIKLDYHDSFRKKPVFNFEMHTYLYDEDKPLGWQEYYENKINSLDYINGSYEKRFSNEDFYVYAVSHAYKHQISGGIGIKTLVDIYLMNSKLNLNREYIVNELKTLGIADFEETLVSLSRVAIFGNPTNEQQRLIDEIILAGAYGNIVSRMNVSLSEITGDKEKASFKDKFKFVFKRLFPSPSFMKTRYCKNKSWLVPFSYIYRWFVRIPNFKRIFREIKALIKKSKKGGEENEKLGC